MQIKYTSGESLSADKKLWGPAIEIAILGAVSGLVGIIGLVSDNGGLGFGTLRVGGFAKVHGVTAFFSLRN
jgi:hypothetical protein